MATFPVVNHISNSARTEGEVKADLEAMLAATKQIPGAAQVELTNTIAGGSITPAGGGGVIVIDTESAAATDDLTNIVQTNYPDGSMLLLRNSNAARFVVVKHAATGAGQILLARSADYVMDDTKKFLLIQRRGTDWVELSKDPSVLTMPVVSKTANFTVQKEDHGKIFTCTGVGGLNVSFAAAASVGAGFCVAIINNHSLDNVVTLDPNGSETVDGRTTLFINRGRGSLLFCDGTSWWTLGYRNKPRYALISYAASLVLNADDADYIEVGPLTGNVTTLQVQADVGTRTRIRFKQDATGGRTVANPASSKITGSIDTTASKASYLDLYFSAQDLRWEGVWSTVPV